MTLSRVAWLTRLAAAALLLSPVPAAAADRPATGKPIPGFEPLEAAVDRFMELVDCQAATVAVSKDGHLLYSRGFGWQDQRKKKPTPPDALMRIASVSKAITATMIRTAVRSKLLTLDAKAFDLIGVRPSGGRVADPRVRQITVAQLLDHKGGWDSGQSFDPMFRTRQIAADLKISGPVTPAHVVQYMLTQPLQFAPGERSAYSNFGYCVLGRVLEKVYHKSYLECVQQLIARPLGAGDIKLGHSSTAKRDPREVWYPVLDGMFSVEVMDSHGGLIASAPALCRFLDAYWISGEPRRPGQWGSYQFFGSLPGTTAIVRQRRDGFNVAVLLNNRRNESFKQDNERLGKWLDEAVDRLARQPVLSSSP